MSTAPVTTRRGAEGARDKASSGGWPGGSDGCSRRRHRTRSLARPTASAERGSVFQMHRREFQISRASLHRGSQAGRGLCKRRRGARARPPGSSFRSGRALRYVSGVAVAKRAVRFIWRVLGCRAGGRTGCGRRQFVSKSHAQREPEEARRRCSCRWLSADSNC